MKLYFVRHGETEWNVKKKIQGKTDIPLNENGIRQAKELACQLVEEDISVKHVYHSPQLRAAETARIAAEALHATCIPLDGLVEMNLGSWEGSNWRVIERENSPEYQEWRKDRRYVRTPGGGECYNDVVKRTLDAMEYIMKRENGDVLIVTHSAIIMALRCYIAGLPFDEMVRKFKTRNAKGCNGNRLRLPSPHREIPFEQRSRSLSESTGASDVPLCILFAEKIRSKPS